MSKQIDGKTMLHDIAKHRGWSIRTGQMEMVEAIDETVNKDGWNTISVGAPTGTGKSLGILCGAVTSGKRMIITTSTKALQNQLRSTELPMFAKDVRDLYGRDISWAIVKGQNNYPCIHALNELLKEFPMEGSLFDNSDNLVSMLLHGMHNKVTTAIDEGDWGNLDCESELRMLPMDIQLRLLSESCSHASSAFSDKSLTSPAEILDKGIDECCTYNYAYAHAMLSDIVVMNTHLLVFEVEKFPWTHGKKGEIGTIHEEDSGIIKSQLLGTPIIAMDEAHHVPNITASCLSTNISIPDVIKNVEHDSEILHKINKKFTAHLSLKALKQCKGDIDKLGESKNPSPSDRRYISEVMHDVHMSLRLIIEDFKKHSDSESFKKSGAVMVERWEKLSNQAALLSEKSIEQNSMGWTYDTTIMKGATGELSINTVPLILTTFGPKLATIMNQEHIMVPNEYENGDITIITCSGTLPPSLPKTMGFAYPTHKKVESPFDPSKGRIYVPTEDVVPSPPKNFFDDAAQKNRMNAIQEQLDRVVETAGGRTLVLTTSKDSAMKLAKHLRKKGKFPVLSQYDGDREETLKQFMEVEESVFVGTQSFWEGVDIPGSALSSVFIDKILFPNTSDAVFAAREKFIKSQGGNSFHEVQCNHAAVMIAQGVGRLIRSVDDCGLVTIADPRIMDTQYGPRVMSLLEGETPITRDESSALNWLSHCVHGTQLAKGEWRKVASKPVKGRKRGSVSIVYK